MSRLIFITTLLFALPAQALLTLPDKAEIGHSYNYALNGGVERGTATFARYSDILTVTISNATPAVFTTAAAHTLVIGDQVTLATSGALPTGLNTGTAYFVVSVPSTTTFTVSATRNGSAIATTSAGSGTHTAGPGRPLKALGGTPSKLTLTSSATAPIQGARSLVVTNAGGAVAGEGFTMPLAVDVVDRGVTMNVNFSYIVQSGTFGVGSVNGQTIIDSDLEPFMYDVTNGQLIPITPTLLQCGGVAVKCDYVGQFVSPVNASSLRLVLHAVTPNTLAWSVKFDAFNVSRAVRNFGLNGFDMKLAGVVPVGAVTTAPTKGATSVDTQYFGRVADQVRVKAEFRQTSAGTGGSGEYLPSLPPGLSFDLTKLQAYSVAIAAGGAATVPICLGQATVNDATNNLTLIGCIVPYDATRFRIYGVYTVSNGTSNKGTWGSGVASLSTASLSVTYDFTAPIAGWSAGAQSSDQAPSVPVNFSVFRSAALNMTTTQSTLIFDNVLFDSHSGYNSTTGKYSVKVPGLYHCDEHVDMASTGSNSSGFTLITVDGVQKCFDHAPSTTYADTASRCSKDIPLNVGQILDVQTYGSPAIGIRTGEALTYFTCHKVNQGLGVTATDPLTVTYGLTTAQSVAANGVIKYDTKLDDSLLIYNSVTGLTTVGANGMFKISAVATANAATPVYVKINGVSSGYLASVTAAGVVANGSITRRLTQGSTVGVYSETAATFAAPSTNGFQNSFTIERTGP